MARRKRRARATRDLPGWDGLGRLGGSDIEAIAFLVLMLAAKSAREDLKAIMDAVRRINRRKKRKARRVDAKRCRPDRIDAAVRGADRATRKGMQLTGSIDELSIDALREDLDALGDLGQLKSMRLQMAMDRMSKMMEMLSNVAKKTSDTAAAIAANLK